MNSNVMLCYLINATCYVKETKMARIFTHRLSSDESCKQAWVSEATEARSVVEGGDRVSVRVVAAAAVASESVANDMS